MTKHAPRPGSDGPREYSVGDTSLIDSAALVDQVTTAVKRAPWVGFDLEFVSQERYWPDWCLLQIAVGGITQWDAAMRPFVAQETISDGQQSLLLIDSKAAALPLLPGQQGSEMRLALTHLMAAIAQHHCVIAHSPRQDLWILRSHVGAEFSGVFDTQIAASFSGIGDQVGYARLVADLLGVQLSKEQQWTNWARRPLSPGQLGYALDDVRYLRPLQLELQRRLGHRADWATEEARAIIDAAVEAATLAPAQAWRDVGHVRGLTPIAARIVMATASWRLQTARTINKPLGHVLEDSALVDFARKCAHWDGSSTLDGFVDQAMGAARIAPAHRPTLQAEMAHRIADRESAIPPELVRPDIGPIHGRPIPLAPAIARQVKWAEQLVLVTTATSEELGIAPRLLCNRSDTEHFARDYSNGGIAAVADASVLRGWRRAQIGDRWLAFFAGTGALVADANTQLGLRWRWLDAQNASASLRPSKGKTKKASPKSAKAKQPLKKVPAAKKPAGRSKR
jgi:ribonuclease D